MTILNKIKELRTEKGLTQKAIAKKLNISPNTYSQYENGKIEIKLSILVEIARIFNVSLSYLVDDSAKRMPYKDCDIATLSKRLKILRLNAGYTQKQLAELIGLTQSSYSRYGTGIDHIVPKTIYLTKFAEIFNVSVSYLLGESSDPDISNVNTSESMDFPKRLIALRKNNGYNQADIAKYLNVSRQAYNKYERGLSKPKNETLKQLANFFGVSVEYLLCETDEPES